MIREFVAEALAAGAPIKAADVVGAALEAEAGAALALASGGATATVATAGGVSR